MKRRWRYWKSFVGEEIIEQSTSPYNERLEVSYFKGRKLLNTQSVNYSFGSLDQVFRVAFSHLKIDRRGIRKVLLLGLGGGNILRLLKRSTPDCFVRGVEIDPEVVRLARNHFELDDYTNVEIVIDNAFAHVKYEAERYDLVIVDLFIDAQVPREAEQEWFLKRLSQLLGPDGLLMFNRLLHTPELRELTEAFTRKMQQVLPGTEFFKADQNRMLYYEKGIGKHAP